VITCNRGLMYVQTNTPSHVQKMAGHVQVKWVHQLMVSWQMVLGEEISVILFAASPEQIKLALYYSVLDPMVLHIRGLLENLRCKNLWSVELLVSIGVLRQVGDDLTQSMC